MSSPGHVAPENFSGDFITADHSDYNATRRAFFLQFDRHPVAIARCLTAADVALAVRHARHHGLEIAVRAGGHSIPGFSTIDGGLLIDVSALTGIRIDPSSATATIEAGVVAAGLIPAAAEHGLAPVGGWGPQPAHIGLAIHGGRSPLSRRYGWASDHIRSAVVVTAEGETVIASEHTNAELLYGIRGAGSNFGIVVEAEIDLVPMPERILAGTVLYDQAAIEPVTRGVLEALSDGVSDALGLMLTVSRGVDGDPTLALHLIHTGDSDAARHDIDRLLAFATPIDGEVLPTTFAAEILDKPQQPPGRWFWEEQGSDLGPAEIASALAAEALKLPASDTPGIPDSFLVLEPGGPGAELPTRLPTPVPRRSHLGFMVFSAWSLAPDDERHTDWVTTTAERLRQTGVGNNIPLLNYRTISGPATVESAYGPEAYARLRAVKAAYDPGNVFRRNHNVEPG